MTTWHAQICYSIQREIQLQTSSLWCHSSTHSVHFINVYVLHISQESKLVLLCSYVVINCIPTPPHYPGNSWVLAGHLPRDLQNIVFRRPGAYPGLMGGDVSSKGALNLPWDLPRDVCIYARTLNKGAQGYGDLPRDLQGKCPCSPGQYLGLYFWHHKVQNWIPRQILAIPG